MAHAMRLLGLSRRIGMLRCLPQPHLTPLSIPHLFLHILREHVALKHAREVGRRGCVECTRRGAEARLGQLRPSTCISRVQRCIVVPSSNGSIASSGRIVTYGSPVCSPVHTDMTIIGAATGGNLESTPQRDSV